MTAGIRYFAFGNLFLVALIVFSVLTPPQASVGADFLVLGLTYGVVLSMVGGVWGALRLVRRVDGEMDWGEATEAARTVSAGSHAQATR